MRRVETFSEKNVVFLLKKTEELIGEKFSLQIEAKIFCDIFFCRRHLWHIGSVLNSVEIFRLVAENNGKSNEEYVNRAIECWLNTLFNEGAME